MPSIFAANQSSPAVSGQAAKNAARIFHIGTILAVLIPFPVAIFWCGASMLVYAMNRHHPNPRVGYYTQRGATRFYAIAGLFIPVATFFPVDWRYYVAYWAFAGAVLLPLSIWDIIRIRREDWPAVSCHGNNVDGGSYG